MIKPLVLVDGYDVTKWVSSISVRDDGEGREAQIVFAGASWLVRGQRVDIYATDDGASPVPLLVRGTVDDTGDFGAQVDGNSATVSATVRDFLYFAKRVVAKQAIIFAKNAGAANSAADAKGIEDFVFYPAVSCSAAVRGILQLAGVNVVWATLDYPLTAVVIEAGTALWNAASELWEPFAPILLAARDKRQLLVLDRVWATARGLSGKGADITSGLINASFAGAKIRQIRSLRLRLAR